MAFLPSPHRRPPSPPPLPPLLIFHTLSQFSSSSRAFGKGKEKERKRLLHRSLWQRGSFSHRVDCDNVQHDGSGMGEKIVEDTIGDVSRTKVCKFDDLGVDL